MSEVVSLNADRLRLEVFPSGGGSIVRFAWSSKNGEWVDLMRPASAEFADRRDPIWTSCFPLVPYCDVVTGGAFEFQDVHYRLPLNHPASVDPIHGEGWISSWTVESMTGNTLLLRFVHASGTPGFPFSYRASLGFELSGDRLAVSIALTNEDSRPMPGGIGIHPYYVRTPDMLVSADAARVWPSHAARDKAVAIPVPPEWNFRTPRSLGDIDLDNSFAAWSGVYDLNWPSRATRLTVKADPVFRNLLIYVPRNADYFCMEPTSNAMDAFNLASMGLEGHDVSVLQPGQSLSGRVVFQPSDLA